jgi:hypothetical protein
VGSRLMTSRADVSGREDDLGDLSTDLASL